MTATSATAAQNSHAGRLALAAGGAIASMCLTVAALTTTGVMPAAHHAPASQTTTSASR
jgi:hypothetical protein